MPVPRKTRGGGATLYISALSPTALNQKSSAKWYSQLVSIARETNMPEFDRITQNPGVMGGKPCIRGLRVTVGMIVGQIGAGHTIEELLADYPYLEREDIMQALRYAPNLSSQRQRD
jgi:uncharacterized protein (DUF433 family)